MHQLLLQPLVELRIDWAATHSVRHLKCTQQPSPELRNGTVNEKHNMTIITNGDGQQLTRPPFARLLAVGRQNRQCEIDEPARRHECSGTNTPTFQSPKQLLKLSLLYNLGTF